MEEAILEIIKENDIPDDFKTSTLNTAIEITINFKAFLAWKDNPKCDFSTCWNNDDPNRDKICYERNGKHYNLEHVWEYWQSHK